MTEPSWVEHAIWWQVYPLGFVGAPIRDRPDDDSEIVHRLPHIEKWLDYAVELGASGLALGPVFSSSTHGYDTTDYFTIDPRLGDLGDFDALVAAAHQRGMKVMLDGVFNHVGQAFPAYRSALDGGPDGVDQNWFHIDWDASGAASHDAFEGHDELVTLNHREPAVVDMVAEVMSYWLGRGADSWRLDAAYAVSPSFWAQVLPRVRDKFPDAYFVGEVIHGDYEKIVGASGMDSVTQYELWKAIWSAITAKNFFELSWAIERHNNWLGDFVPLTFVGNHDVNRLASTITDERHLPHAYVVLFTLGGTPSVYYGDEQAFRGIKEERIGGDDDVRPSFPQGPSELATFGDWAYRLHQELIGLRRRHPWLHRASAETVTLENELFMYRLARDDEQLVVALNLGDKETRQKIKGVTAVVAGEAEYGNSYATIPAHGWAVLS